MRRVLASAFDETYVFVLALLIQGMLIFRLAGPDFLAGSLGFLVAASASVLGLIYVYHHRPERLRELTILTLFLILPLPYLLLRYYMGPGNAYGIWKIGNFIILSIVPACLIVWTFPCRQILIQKFLVWIGIFTVIPLLFVALIVVEFWGGPIRWLLQEAGLDLIGISRALGVGCLVSLSFFWKQRSLRSLGLVVASVLFFAAQMVIGERGPVIAVVAGVLATVGLSYRSGAFRDINARVGAIVGSVTLSAIVGATGYLMYSRSAEGSNEQRLGIYLKGWEDWLEHPVLGVGVGMFQFVDGIFEYREYVHCLPFEIAVETGGVGLVLFLLFFILPLFYLKKNDSKTIGCNSWFLTTTSSLYVFAVVAALVSGDLATNYLVWVFAALFYAVRLESAWIDGGEC